MVSGGKGEGGVLDDEIGFVVGLVMGWIEGQIW
jgi:hypothetical protein